MGAFINRIAIAVPPVDVHETFIAFADRQLSGHRREQRLFKRMVAKSGIEHRYSFLAPARRPESGALDAAGLFQPGHFPGTGARMRLFENHGPSLAVEAVSSLLAPGERERITHVLITCCTGLASPGIDLELIARCGLRGSVERSVLGFMGCYAAINALKLARHIVRSEPEARVLITSLELCTLHLQETRRLEELVSFLLWGDGAAACLVTAEPQGISLDGFCALLAEGTRELITWNVRDAGFEMCLSGQVPTAIQDTLTQNASAMLDGASPEAIELWAVHPGGRTVLDAVEKSLELPLPALAASRDILRRYGNMSSATVLFVLESMLRSAPSGAAGCAMSFGPGLVAETMRFHTVS